MTIVALALVVVAMALLLGHANHASAVDLPPVAKEMSAFGGPPLSGIEVPQDVRGTEARLSSRAGSGEAIPGQEHRLLHGLGANGVDIYAFPTTGDSVCYVVTEQTHVASCIDRFTEESANVGWAAYFGEDAPLSLAGIVPDRTVVVIVKTTRGAQAARVENNAFYWQARDRSLTRADLLALTTRDRSGTTSTVKLSP